jgi:hypothetical protein
MWPRTSMVSKIRTRAFRNWEGVPPSDWRETHPSQAEVRLVSKRFRLIPILTWRKIPSAVSTVHRAQKFAVVVASHAEQCGYGDLY